MTDHVNREQVIRALVGKWRALAAPHLNAAGDEAEWAACRKLCADELDTLLAHSPSETPQETGCKHADATSEQETGVKCTRCDYHGTQPVRDDAESWCCPRCGAVYHLARWWARNAASPQAETPQASSERIYEMLATIEWASGRPDPEGRWHPACPACRGLKGTPIAFLSQYYGHRADCWLHLALIDESRLTTQAKTPQAREGFASSRRGIRPPDERNHERGNR
jgi:hypothetical protein